MRERSLAVDAILAFVVFTVVTQLVLLLLKPPMDDEPEQVARRIELSATAMLCGIGALLVFAKFVRPPVRGFRRGVLPGTATRYALFLLLWVPFAFFGYPLLLELCGVELEAQTQLAYFTGEPATSWGFWVMTLVASLGAPIGEEILFRGYIQEACKRVMPVWAAVLVTAAGFGMMHTPHYALPIGLLGVFFGYVRERYGCLEAPIFAHALHNSLTLAVTMTFPETIG